MQKPVILAVDGASDPLAPMAKVLAANYEVKSAASGAAALIADELGDIINLDFRQAAAKATAQVVAPKRPLSHRTNEQDP